MRMDEVNREWWGREEERRAWIFESISFLVKEVEPERRRRREKGGRNQEKCTFSAEGHPLLLFMLMFFMEMRVMLSFSPLAVEQLGKEGNMGYRQKEP